MKGSGLEEVMGLLFGPNTVEHVLSGKAYDRAIRGHFLIHAALNDLLFDFLRNPNDSSHAVIAVGLDNEIQMGQLVGSISTDDMAHLEAIYEQTVIHKVYAGDETALQSDSLLKFCTQLQHLKQCLCRQSRTAHLWILYMMYVDLVKLFLLAERTGNWLIHLQTVHGMLGLFAATGHVNYAKSARLYLQEMVNLPETHRYLHEQFMNG